ncbi:iron complex transport system permease protein [Pseudomonas cuatrocienegasensis]|uniref:Iron complex transport system permease protein n=1 Tax=Pseudomonas cuatrocienegasensis TaxID=543360 RepID=A0ABY1BRE4_9PSED|nr:MULTISPECIES: iron ABC transporter permease [Pseudomonas]OEC32743.1 ABC transporter permease [Pseudomonas sp. 21C1]SER45475.1 iron complex transport system permease protein [Pseudomonas cuatrocienegasensis]
MPRISPPLTAHCVLRLGDYSLLLHRRSSTVALFLCLALLLSSAWILAFGANGLTPWAALRAAFGQGEPMQLLLIRELRVPRLLSGLFSGAALGAAGCLLQTLARNRLATPGVIGIDNGATAFAVASIVAVPTSLAPSALALSGAATAAVLTFALAAGGGARGYRFIVVGIAIGALFGAATNLMLARADIDAANAAYPWTVGSLNARPSQAVWLLGGGLLLGLPAAKLLVRALSLMRFSDSVAIGLGVRLRLMRVLSLLLCVWLTALAVAVAGPVGLIALVAPEMARHLCARHGVPVLNAALCGALLMILADWLGRHLLAPIEIPVGIITAIVGAPYLLWILLRQSSRSSP